MLIMQIKIHPVRYLLSNWLMKIKYHMVIYLVTILILALSNGVKTTAQSLNYRLTAFSPKEYSAHFQIFCLTADTAGRIFAGTALEILSYDGNAFQKHFVKAGMYIMSMDIDPAGRIWLGGQGDFGYMGISRQLAVPINRDIRYAPIGSRQKSSPDKSGSPLRSDQQLAESESVKLQFYSLLHLLPDSLRDFNVIWNTHVYNGKVYFNGYKYLFVYDPQTGVLRTIFPQKRFYRSHNLKDRLIIKDSRHGLYEVGADDSLRLIDGSGFFKDKGVMAVINTSEISKISEVYDQYIIVTRRSGIYRLTGGEVTLFTTPRWQEALSKAQAYCAIPLNQLNSVSAESSEGPVLWNSKSKDSTVLLAVGTLLSGIWLFSPDGGLIKVIDRQSGMPDNYVWYLHEDRYGSLWAGTNNGLTLIHTHSPQELEPEGEKYAGSIQDVVVRTGKGAQEEVLLATMQGVYRYLPDTALDENGLLKMGYGFVRISGTEEQCMDLHMTTQGSGSHGGRKANRVLVAAANKGLLELRRKETPEGITWKVAELSSYHCYTITGMEQVTGKKLVAFGGRDGVVVYDLTANAVLLHTKDLPEEVFSLACEPRAINDSLTLWAALPTRGLLQLRMDTIFTSCSLTLYDTSHGLPEGEILCFQYGGEVKFGTDRGLYQVKRQKAKSKSGEVRFSPDSTFGSMFADGSREVFRLVEGYDGEAWLYSDKLYHLIPTSNGYRTDSLPFLLLEIGDIRAIYPEQNSPPLKGGVGGGRCSLDRWRPWSGAP